MNRGTKNHHPIHAKLMSPERKKANADGNLRAEMRERHERAREARMQLEIDRANRMRARELGAQRELEEAERAKLERQQGARGEAQASGGDPRGAHQRRGS